MRTADNGVRRYQLILGSLFAAVSAIYLLAVHQTGMETEVMSVYFPYADELMHGGVPETEYPPLTLVFIAAPRLFAETPFCYNIAFVAEVCIFFMVGLLIMGKLAKRYNQSQHKAILAYTGLMLLLVEFAVDRYDMFPAILTLLSFYCLVTKRYALAFVLLSMATMTKLYPAVLFPIYLIPFLMNKDWRNALKGTGLFFAVAVLIALPFALLGPDSALNFFDYQMGRPLHIESVAASFIHIVSVLGMTDAFVLPGYGSEFLAGPWPDAAAQYLMPMMFAVLIAIYALYAYMLFGLRKDRQDNENDRMILLGGSVLLSLLAFILIGKIFSPQYIIWIVPFIIFMLMTSIDHVSKKRILMLSIAAIALTQLKFVMNTFVDGADIADINMLIILARNVVVLVLFAYVLWTCKKNIGRRWRRAQQPDA
ncbi:MAG: DUF2029 domain-containing protein [Methanomassiliicoccaceae archaeon]|nr:DUF2029 domain-containing protein [Methanomassiliicoccaceae archaeon]